MLEAPNSIDKDVRRILTNLQLSSEALRHLSIKSPPSAVHLECFENVRRNIEIRGGSAVHGWLIWRWPNVLVEAEFHCVWQSPSGELEDVTPRPGGVGTVMFVMDPQRAYEGISVDNIRIPLKDDKLVRDFIRCFELKFKVLNRGHRATQHGLISIPAAEIAPIAQLAGLTEAMLHRGLREHSQCICGSGRKYKKCHGKML